MHSELRSTTGDGLNTPAPNLFLSYVKALLEYARIKLILSLVLTLGLGLTQGVGLLMIIPLLELIGLGVSESSGGITALARQFMNTINLPLTLPSILSIYIVVVIAHAVAARYREILNADLVHGFTRYLQNRIYDALTHADWLYFTRTRSADITHVLTRSVQMVGMGTQQFLQLIVTVVITVIHIGVALKICASMTAVVMIIGSALLLLLRPFNREAFKAGVGLHDAQKAMFSAVTEHLSGMKVVKTYGAEERHFQRFCSITAELFIQILRFIRISTNTRLLLQVISVIVLSAFIYSAIEVLHLAPADLLVLAFIFIRLLPKLSQLQQSHQQISNMLPSFQAAQNMYQELQAGQTTRAAKTVGPVKLEQDVCFRRISFRYNSGSESFALREIELRIPARKMTAIVGPSGAGKSTLADLLMGLLTPMAGTITLDGQALTEQTVGDWRRAVGYVPQETFLFNDTVRANLLWARPEAQEKDLFVALKAAAAEDFISKLPQGLDTVVGDRGVRLSGGERQRIALARALLRQPTLLLLDEATSNLDLENEYRIQKAVERLHGEMTIVIIAHRLSTVRWAEQIVVIEQGRVVESGRWDELIAKPDSRFSVLALAVEGHTSGSDS